MANDIVASNPSSFADGTFPSRRLSRRGELIVPDFWFQLAAEERMFVSGDDVEATHNDGQASFTDTAPTYIFAAPAGGTVCILKYAEFELTTEGGAAPVLDIAYIPLGSIITSAGTTLDTFNMRGGTGRRTSRAIHQVNPTITALGGSDNVQIGGLSSMPDNLISTVAIAAFNTETTTYKLNFDVPLLLENDAMVAVWISTGTADSKYRTYWMWGEMDSEKV